MSHGKSEHVVVANEESFDREVLQSKTPVLVDFGGQWCGPCKVLAPIVERIANDHVGTIKVVTVDIDDSPGIAQRYGIRGVPTVIAFNGGEAKKRAVGVTTREKLLGLLQA